jgi:hypothetical protein
MNDNQETGLGPFLGQPTSDLVGQPTYDFVAQASAAIDSLNKSIATAHPLLTGAVTQPDVLSQTLQGQRPPIEPWIGHSETREDIPHKSGYATVAYNNPSGMWEGPSSRKFGATTYGILDDPDRNHIASFETPVHGAAAQFHLLADPNAPYINKPVIDVIRKWSKSKTDKTGSEQNIQDYVKSLGLSANTIVTPELLRSPTGIALAKHQAHWEGGGNFKMSDEDWQKAQAMAYGNSQ